MAVEAGNARASVDAIVFPMNVGGFSLQSTGASADFHQYYCFIARSLKHFISKGLSPRQLSFNNHGVNCT